MKLVRDHELLRAICAENGIRVGTVFELFGLESKGSLRRVLTRSVLAFGCAPLRLAARPCAGVAAGSLVAGVTD